MDHSKSKKFPPAGHLNEKIDHYIRFYLEGVGVFLEGNSPEGRKKIEHQIRPKGGKFYLQQKVKNKHC